MPIRQAALAAKRVAEKEREEDEVDAEEGREQPEGGAPAERLGEDAAQQRAERGPEEWRGVEDAHHLSALCGVAYIC